MREKMLIRESESSDPRARGKYYVCYASDGSPVSNTTDYKYFNTISGAKQFIRKNDGAVVKE